MSSLGDWPAALERTWAVAVSSVTVTVADRQARLLDALEALLQRGLARQPDLLERPDQLRRQDPVAERGVVARGGGALELGQRGADPLLVGRAAVAAAGEHAQDKQQRQAAGRHGPEHRMGPDGEFTRADRLLAPLLPLLVAGAGGPGPLRGHPPHRPGHGRARRGRRRDPGGRRAVPRLHARPAAPRLPQRPHRADRGPLGADGRRHAVGGVLHGHGRRRRGRDLLRPGGRGRARLRGVRRPRHARVLHPRPLPQARRRPDRRPPAGRALRALARRGDAGARGGRARPAHDHVARRGVAPAGRDRRRQHPH